MKGYELIAFSVGIVLFLVGLLTLLDGLTVQRQGIACATGNATTCERQILVGAGALRVAPLLFAVGVVFLGVGAGLVGWRRWYRPREDEPDEGPGYP